MAHDDRLVRAAASEVQVIPLLDTLSFEILMVDMMSKFDFT